MKFKVGDKIRAIGKFDRGEMGMIIRVDNINALYETTFGWKAEENIKLIEETRKPKRKFEIGDKVKIIGSVKLLGMCGLALDKVGMIGVVTGYGCKDYHGSPYSYMINGYYFPEAVLKLVESKEKQSNEIRQFGTGATRDANDHPEKTKLL